MLFIIQSVIILKSTRRTPWSGLNMNIVLTCFSSQWNPNINFSLIYVELIKKRS